MRIGIKIGAFAGVHTIDLERSTNRRRDRRGERTRKRQAKPAIVNRKTKFETFRDMEKRRKGFLFRAVEIAKLKRFRATAIFKNSFLPRGYPTRAGYRHDIRVYT